jgi:hypothetical protein
MHIEFHCKSSCLTKKPTYLATSNSHKLNINFVLLDKDRNLIDRVEHPIRITANIIRDSQNFENLKAGHKRTWSGRSGDSDWTPTMVQTTDYMKPVSMKSQSKTDSENVLFDQMIAFVPAADQDEVRTRLLKMSDSKRMKIIEEEQQRFVSNLLISTKSLNYSL